MSPSEKAKRHGIEMMRSLTFNNDGPPMLTPTEN